MEIPDEPTATSAWASLLRRRSKEQVPAKPSPKLTAAEYIREMLTEFQPEPDGPRDGCGDLEVAVSDKWLAGGMGWGASLAWRFVHAANEQGLLSERLTDDELLQVFNATGDSVYDEQFDGA
jgi:hypothetical protein